jgi:hypothetical protein
MTQPTTAATAELEAALRDAAAHAMRPETPTRLLFGFLRMVIAHARSLRQYRVAAGLPPALSDELALLLGTVSHFAAQRMYDLSLTQAEVLRMHSAFAGLGRAFLAALPIPEKAQKLPVAPKPPAVKAAFAPPASIPSGQPRRKNEYDNIGVIAIRALDAATMKDPILAYHALQKATGGKIAA